MADDQPQTPSPRNGLPPVRMALRVKGRHSHRGGPHLARQVAAARAPKHLAASTRLTHHAPPPPAEAAPAEPELPYGLPPFAAEALGVAREPAPAAGGPDRPVVPELSD